MAKSGSISRNLLWTTTKLSWKEIGQSIASNESTIEYSLTLYRQYNISSSTAKSYNIKINGSTVKSGNTTIGGIGTKTITSGKITIPHDPDGRKTFDLSFSLELNVTLSGSYVGTAAASGRGTLNQIPRESRVTSFNLTSIKPTEIQVSYSVDKPIDRVRCRINGGSWTTLATNGVITGRNPDTTYRIQIEVRNSASGLTTLSGTKSIKTQRLTTANMKSFNTGDSVTIELNRIEGENISNDVTLQYKDSGEWHDWILEKERTDSVTFNPTSAELNVLYNARSNYLSAGIRLKITNRWGHGGDIQGVSYSTEAVVNIVNANPSISGVSYRDINSAIQNLLGNNQKILRNKSELRVTTGVATTQKGATLVRYIVRIGGSEYKVNANGEASQSNVDINVGRVNQSSNQIATLTVVDSRGNIAMRDFTVQMLDYQEPQITFASADRENNYEEPTTLNIQARRSIIEPASNDINDITIRYRIKENPSGSYGSWVTLSTTNGSKDGLFRNVTISQYLNDYPNDKSYTIELAMRDEVSSSWKYSTVDLSKAMPLMRFMEDLIKIQANLHIEPLTNKEGFKIVGKDHTYLELYPRGESEGRKAFVGFSGANNKNLSITNEDTGDMQLITRPGTKVDVRRDLQVQGKFYNPGFDDHLSSHITYVSPTLSRNVQTEGNQTITIPFKAEVVFIDAIVNGTKKMSNGKGNAGNQECFYVIGDNWYRSNGNIIVIADSGGSYTTGRLYVNDDNIIISWIKNGNGGTGTAYFRVIAFAHRK